MEIEAMARSSLKTESRGIQLRRAQPSLVPRHLQSCKPTHINHNDPPSAANSSRGETIKVYSSSLHTSHFGYTERQAEKRVGPHSSELIGTGEAARYHRVTDSMQTKPRGPISIWPPKNNE